MEAVKITIHQATQTTYTDLPCLMSKISRDVGPAFFFGRRYQYIYVPWKENYPKGTAYFCFCCRKWVTSLITEEADPVRFHFQTHMNVWNLMVSKKLLKQIVDFLTKRCISGLAYHQKNSQNLNDVLRNVLFIFPILRILLKFL